jgi:hypothetical protein
VRKNTILFVLIAIFPLTVVQQPRLFSQATAAAAQYAAPGGPPTPHTLLDGTPVKLRLGQTISSANAKVGQEIPFEVVEEISVDQVVVLPKGSPAIGVVTEAEAKKSMGRAGKLNVSISYARLADEEKVALRAMQDNKGGGHTGAMAAGMVGTAIVFFPAAPLLLFVHGKDITVPQGTEITAFVDGDTHLNMANFRAASKRQSAPRPAPVSEEASTASVVRGSKAQASLSIDSTPAGADVEIDGEFVGNTPSTVSVATGRHQISVKKKGFDDWTKNLNVTGGTIHLNAELEEGLVK